MPAIEVFKNHGSKLVAGAAIVTAGCLAYKALQEYKTCGRRKLIDEDLEAALKHAKRSRCGTSAETEPARFETIVVEAYDEKNHGNNSDDDTLVETSPVELLRFMETKTKPTVIGFDLADRLQKVVGEDIRRGRR